MEKIGFVVRQYGLEVNGGGETHCRVVAEHLRPFYETEVLTSTSMRYPFEEFYTPGVEKINGVTVRRFSLKKKQNREKMAQLNNRMLNGEKEAEREWIEESGPYCPDFILYLKNHAAEYKVIIFFAYGHYLTYAGLKLNLPNTIFVPLAHDEGNIYRAVYKDVFQYAKAFLFNTYEERDLVYRLFGLNQLPHKVTCIGVDAAVGKKEAMPATFMDIDSYIIYVGRVTYSKNFAELNKYFITYKERHKTNLRLVVLGRIREDYPIRFHKDIIFAGFVSEEEKRALIQNAEFMVLPSKTESLSFVILESFMQKKPVIVNGYSPVLVGQCRRSNAGLYYTNYAEFEAEMEYLLSNPDICRKLGENGEKFVAENYNWNVVIDNIKSLIEEMGRNHIE